MSASSTRVLLGRITGAQGLRGEVTIRSETSDPMDIGSYGMLSDHAGTRAFAVRPQRMTPKGAVIAKIDGVTDRTGAEQLAGTDLYIERTQLPPPADGEFYHVDLIGLQAFAPDGAVLGKVIAVHNFGAGDLLEIAIAAGGATELIPLSGPWVSEIDVGNGRMTVALPDVAVDDAEPA